MENTATQNKRTPVDSVKLGRIVASIWKNQTDSGFRYSVSIQRFYRSGNTWKYSESFSRDDLPILGKVLDQVHTRLFELQAQDTADVVEPE